MRLVSRLFCCISFFVISMAATAQSLDCQQQHCMGVIDAGSSGSRFHIYTYDLDESNTAVHITEKWSKKIYPGFSTLEANQNTINTYLGNLFAGAPETSLPVYFYATAGMRILPQPKQELLYGYLKNWFSTQSQWQLKESKTITGREEGILGWLAINYQLGTLTDESKPAVGVMDMGGVSVQVVFPTSNEASTGSNDIEQIKLYGRQFNIFVHSFLGLGQTEITHQFLDLTHCFVNEYRLPSGTSAEGDAYACKNEVSPLMNKVHRVNEIVQPLIQANPVENWYAMGGVVELAKSKPFNFNETQFNNQELLEQANSAVCHQQWSSLLAQFPGNDYLYTYCLFPSYYYALMVDGYGLTPRQKVNFMSPDKNGDWTMGVVLHQ